MRDIGLLGDLPMKNGASPDGALDGWEKVFIEPRPGVTLRFSVFNLALVEDVSGRGLKVGELLHEGDGLFGRRPVPVNQDDGLSVYLDKQAVIPRPSVEELLRYQYSLLEGSILKRLVYRHVKRWLPCL